MDKSKGLATIWIVLISVGGTIIILGVVLLFIYGVKLVKNAAETGTPAEQSQSQKEDVSPLWEPKTVAHDFLTSIFDTVNGGAINLTAANSYLASNLKSKVNNTKESYWDLHGYIHSGPCRISEEETSQTSTTATVKISAEWGDTCNIIPMEPYYTYHMIIEDGEWKITQIDQLTSYEEQVPRDF